MPIFMIAQKEAVIPGVERGPQKQAHDAEMAHLPEPAIRGHNASAHDSEPSPRHLFAEHVVFCEQRALVKTAQLIKARAVKQHVHARAERFVEARKVLHQVVSPVEEPVHGTAPRAGNVGSQTMQMLEPHFFDGTTDECAVGQFYIGINEQHVARDR